MNYRTLIKVTQYAPQEMKTEIVIKTFSRTGSIVNQMDNNNNNNNIRLNVQALNSTSFSLLGSKIFPYSVNNLLVLFQTKKEERREEKGGECLQDS